MGINYKDKDIQMSSLKVVLVDTNPLLVKAWNAQINSIKQYSKFKFKFPSSTLSIETHHGYLSSLPVETKLRSAIVSPANSIGGMGGGFDESLCDLFTPFENKPGKIYNPVESWIRKYLHHGYTPLGTAHVIEFYNFPKFELSKAWLNLHANSIVVLPTMRIPHSIYEIKNTDSQDRIDIRNEHVVKFVFDCIWETLCAVNRHNERIVAFKRSNLIPTIDSDDDIQGTVDTLIIPGLGTGYGNLPIELVAKGMIGALSIWGLDLEVNTKTTIDRGLMCLSFLGENYKLFHNDDICRSEKLMFGDNYTKFDILKNDVGKFYQLLKFDNNINFD